MMVPIASSAPTPEGASRRTKHRSRSQFDLQNDHFDHRKQSSDEDAPLTESSGTNDGDKDAPSDEERDPFSADIGFFTFDEDNLIPSKLSWHGSQADIYNHSISVTRDGESDLSSPSIYSRSTISDSKITVSRALVVSHPTANERSGTPSQKQRGPGPASARSSSTSLARTWSSLRKSTKRGRSFPSPPSIVVPTDGSAHLQTTSLPASPTVEVNAPVRHTASDRIEETSDQATEASKRPFTLRKKSTKSSLASAVKFSGSTSPPPAASPRRRPATPLLASNFKDPDSAPVTDSIEPVALAAPELRQPTIKRYEPRGPRFTKQKDELWSAFKTLDNDFQKFHSKPSTLKVAAIKTTLLPFLKTYAEHPSNAQLRPEDLDRRATILDKWWSAILVILNSRNNQTVSGADRPLLLDAVSAIMDRPEWKCPLSRDDAADPELAPDSDTTGYSSDPGFVFDSVLHNVRNLFVKNLFSQVVMAVERMSMRHAPASLVSFCGKALAYAFFYCNGVADMLVRLWETPPKFLKQAIAACQIAKASHLAELSNDISCAFPRAVQNLAFKSFRQSTAMLKSKPIMPLGLEQVQWRGQWLSRWKGRDSDLFFSFTKHFHFLVSSFLPSDVTTAERSCAPGLLLVQAQVLVNLDSTINRATKSPPPETTAETAVTFDDLVADETPSPGFHLAPLNASRLMAENRLVMLLQSVLDVSKSINSAAAIFFAQSMSDVVKAAAQSISVFNHSACFILCDFLQEYFAIMVQFERSLESTHDLLDWKFWLDVFGKMLQSQNTMTEIRLYTLLYCSWTILTSEEHRAWSLSLDLLLSEQTFANAFYHWCPMVRAYYMRLVCWRIARFDGDASEAEIQILKTLMMRLHTAWRHFKFLVSQAHDNLISLPSTAPCNPAPGRRLLIIRTDTSSNLPGSETSSTSASSKLSSKSGSSQSAGKPATVTDENGGPTILERLASTFEQGNEAAKRRGGMLRSLLTYRGSSPRPESQSGSQEAEDASTAQAEQDLPAAEVAAADRATSNESSERSDSRSSMYEQRPAGLAADPSPAAADKAATYTKASFKFSLEFVDRGPHSGLNEMRLVAPRVPLAAQLLLQSQPGFATDFEARKADLAQSSWTYVGRALAEWTLVVNECQNFFIRRRNEGVPLNKLVETPTLGVESFKRPG